MSPRRRIDPADTVETPAPKPKRRFEFRTLWGLPAIAGAATLVIAAAIVASSLILVSHDRHRDEQVRDATVLSFVRQFMVDYTSLDPLHANDYADRLARQGTGDFAKQFNEKMNEILVAVARSEPTTGSVLEAGVEKWHNDGSVSVLVSTKVTTATPDGKAVVEDGRRWVATAAREGQQWKISGLIEVI